jgi:hypothetical protein
MSPTRLRRTSGGQVEPRQLDSQASLDNNYWRLSISPYLWLAGMDGTGGLAGRGVEVHQSFGDILRHLKVGAMALFMHHGGYTKKKRDREK